MSHFATLLKDAGISKAELARQLGVHPQTVTQWGINPPQYAIKAAELMVENKRLRAAVNALTPLSNE